MARLVAPNGVVVKVADEKVDGLLSRGFRRTEAKAAAVKKAAPAKKAAAKKAAPAKKTAKKAVAKKAAPAKPADPPSTNE